MKNLIIGIVVALVAIGLYFVFKGNDTATGDATLLVSEENPTETILGRGLLAALAELQATKLDTSIFTDRVFLSLSDFGHEIAKQDVGRRNPFAPIGSGTSAVTATTTTTRLR